MLLLKAHLIFLGLYLISFVGGTCSRVRGICLRVFGNEIPLLASLYLFAGSFGEVEGLHLGIPLLYIRDSNLDL